MKAFKRLEGLVAPMDRANVDTDLIIPKQFLKSIRRTGFGPNLFDELVLYTAPMFLGKESKDAISVKAPDKIKASLKLQMKGVEKFKDDIKTTYYNKDI